MEFQLEMKIIGIIGIISFFAFSSAFCSATDVLMYHVDPASTGQYLSETTLSATNVNSTNFGLLATYPTDSVVYTEPLYKSAVPITTGSYAGTTRNVAFVATENDSVYAFDADLKAGSAPLWKTQFSQSREPRHHRALL